MDVSIKKAFLIKTRAFFIYEFLLQLHLEPFYSSKNSEKQLPIRFYDVPGIARSNSVGKDELDMVINGELNKGVKVYLYTK